MSSSSKRPGFGKTCGGKRYDRYTEYKAQEDTSTCVEVRL